MILILIEVTNLVHNLPLKLLLIQKLNLIDQWLSIKNLPLKLSLLNTRKNRWLDIEEIRKVIEILSMERRKILELN